MELLHAYCFMIGLFVGAVLAGSGRKNENPRRD